MWTNLFQSDTSGFSKPDVGSIDIDGVDGPPRSARAPMPGRVAARPGLLAQNAERVDSVSLPKVNTIDATTHISLPPTPGVVLSARPLCAEVPTVPASFSSPHSTSSTPGKYCRVLSSAVKNKLLAQFNLQLVRAEMQTPGTDCYTADELRRTVNLTWRLVTVEALGFEAAMAKAAAWVVGQPIHPAERFFADVLAFSMEAT